MFLTVAQASQLRFSVCIKSNVDQFLSSCLYQVRNYIEARGDNCLLVLWSVYFTP